MANDMDEALIKLQCLQLAHSGSPQNTIAIAEEYFNWIVEKPKVIEPLQKRGRPPKIKT
jgi:hypothetical protein